jgi:hypothetical protein
VNLEDDLRAALRREPAPADFAARILAKTYPSKTCPAPFSVLSFRPRPVTLAIAAALALAALIPPAVHKYRREQRAITARDQLIEALSITRVQLQQAKEKIRRNTRLPL